MNSPSHKKARYLSRFWKRGLSCNAILFPQQSVFERTLQPEMRAHPIRIQCQQPFRTVSSKVSKRRQIVFILIAVNRITLKIELKMSNQDAIATSPYAENDTLDQQPAVRCQTDKKLADSRVNQRGHSNDNADPEHENLDNTQQKIANSDDEPSKRRKTTNPTVNSDTEQEAQLLRNQGKQPALIVNEDPSSENPTASSTGDILKSINDDSNEEEYGPKLSDPLAQRVKGQ